MALTKVPHGLSAHTSIVDGASSTAITIDADGNVGIGTTAPGAKLHMKDGNNSILLDGRTDGGNVAGTGAANISTIDGIYASNTIPGARIAFAHQGSAGQRGGLTFASKNTDDSSNQPTVQGVLTAFGNWGFGTTNPQYKVEVAGTLGVTGATTFTAATAINANVASPLTINANLNGIAYSEIFNVNAGANAAAYFGIVTQNLANSGTIRSGMFFDSSNHLNLINGEAGGAGIVLDDNNAVTMSGNLNVTGNIEASERVRLGNNKLLQARNQQNTQWRSVLKVDTNNDLIIGSSATPITLDVDTTVNGNAAVTGTLDFTTLAPEAILTNTTVQTYTAGTWYDFTGTVDNPNDQGAAYFFKLIVRSSSYTYHNDTGAGTISPVWWPNATSSFVTVPLMTHNKGALTAYIRQKVGASNVGATLQISFSVNTVINTGGFINLHLKRML